MPARRPTSTRKSMPRYGMCAEDEALDTIRHLSVMNKNAQMELVAYNDKHNLPYYDKLEFGNDGWLIAPPSDHRLSDALVFVIIGQNLIASKENSADALTKALSKVEFEGLRTLLVSRKDD
ncbi:hypothetical protein N7530_012184 [Penicillium desertorum]|uniref:Uncharacterized protein n=1 Tax=Penicillium desertorum TaxID=1303715 RepID=A0A9W9WEW2_9EURO|nr:hypothetical protein N7530_012184 [Penicillium desertorum]